MPYIISKTSTSSVKPEWLPTAFLLISITAMVAVSVSAVTNDEQHSGTTNNTSASTTTAHLLLHTTNDSFQLLSGGDSSKRAIMQGKSTDTSADRRGIYIQVYATNSGSFIFNTNTSWAQFERIMVNSWTQDVLIYYLNKYSFNTITLYNVHNSLATAALQINFRALLKRLRVEVATLRHIEGIADDSVVAWTRMATYQNASTDTDEMFDGFVTEIEFWTGDHDPTPLIDVLTHMQQVDVPKERIPGTPLTYAVYAGHINQNATTALVNSGVVDIILFHCYVANPDTCGPYTATRRGYLQISESNYVSNNSGASSRTNGAFGMILSAEGGAYNAVGDTFSGDWIFNQYNSNPPDTTNIVALAEIAANTSLGDYKTSGPLLNFRGYQSYEYCFFAVYTGQTKTQQNWATFFSPTTTTTTTTTSTPAVTTTSTAATATTTTTSTSTTTPTTTTTTSTTAPAPPTTTVPPTPRSGLVATLRILLFGPLGAKSTLRDLFFLDDVATARIDRLRVAVAGDITSRLMLGTSGNCSATAVAPHTQLFAGENATRSGIAILIRVNWFGNWSESTMGTWAQLVGGTTSSIAGRGRTFTAQTAYTTGQSAPLTSSWLTETLAAVQTFQVAANVTVMSSLDVGGVVVSSPRRNPKPTGRCDEGGALECVLIPTLLVCLLVGVILVIILVIYRHIVARGCSQVALYALDRNEDEDEQQQEKYHYNGDCRVPMQRPHPRHHMVNESSKLEGEQNTTTATVTRDIHVTGSVPQKDCEGDVVGCTTTTTPPCDQLSVSSVGVIHGVDGYAEIMDA